MLHRYAEAHVALGTLGFINLFYSNYYFLGAGGSCLLFFFFLENTDPSDFTYTPECIVQL